MSTPAAASNRRRQFFLLLFRSAPLRLTQIKLAGFKSFVDPTTIGTPGLLVGIVGPNGCGKSNVIDAVRWVLGESKASALRGESMQDVIFNGAGERTAVSAVASAVASSIVVAMSVPPGRPKGLMRPLWGSEQSERGGPC